METLPADVVRQILGLLDDRSLFDACCINKYFSKICNSGFWINRLLNKYCLTLDEINAAVCWSHGRNYKSYYISLVTLIFEDKSLSSAAGTGRIDLVKIGLEKRKDVPSIKLEISVALDMAAQKGHADIVKFLITQGAYVNIYHDQALRYSCTNGYTDVVKILLEAGADLHVFDDLPLRYTCEKGHTETVRVLLEYGANVNIFFDGSCPLIGAAYSGNTDMVRLLLEYGANVHADDDAALIDAVQQGHIETVRVLLKAGANVHMKDDWPLKAAYNRGFTDILALLKAAVRG